METFNPTIKIYQMKNEKIINLYNPILKQNIMQDTQKTTNQIIFDNHVDLSENQIISFNQLLNNKCSLLENLS